MLIYEVPINRGYIKHIQNDIGANDATVTSTFRVIESNFSCEQKYTVSAITNWVKPVSTNGEPETCVDKEYLRVRFIPLQCSKYVIHCDNTHYLGFVWHIGIPQEQVSIKPCTRATQGKWSE